MEVRFTGVAISPPESVQAFVLVEFQLKLDFVCELERVTGLAVKVLILGFPDTTFSTTFLEVGAPDRE